MLTRLFASFYKEFLLVFRDYAGLAMLFIMPLFLIVVMAVIMDAPFRDYQEAGIELVLLNEDKDTLGNIIERGLIDSEIFSVVSKVGPENLDRSSIEKLVKDGRFILGVVIPKGATEFVNGKVDAMISSTLSQFGMPIEPKVNAKGVEAPIIQIFLDPAVKKSFASTVTSSIKSFTAQVETKMIIQGFYAQMTEGTMGTQEMKGGLIEFEEIYPSGALSKNEKLFTNSVQHNVPAWTVFAMFLIVVPLASNMIKEREGGSMLRLMVAPGSHMTLIIGKLLFYVAICLIQFYLMILAGIYLMPYFGLPALNLGGSIAGVFIVALMVSFAATSLGVLIGTIFSSYQQASIFGTVINVVMAAVGGIMVPLFAMPETIKFIGRLTPLNWGMESFNDLFLRGYGIIEVLPEVIKLGIFSIIILLLAWKSNKNNLIRK
jgi:ABC-2 type transport system permease protein